MMYLIQNLEKIIRSEIVQSDYLASDINNFEVDEDGNISRLNLYEVDLRSLDILLPFADQLVDLSLKRCQIEKFEAIKRFSNLKRLELYFNSINSSSLESIGQLDNLIDLRLGFTSIKDTKALGNLVNLEKLHLNNSDELKQVQGLGKLKHLKRLNLNSTFIDSIDKIDVHESLNFLSLRDTSVTKISSLDRFPQLSNLEITGQSISKIEGLEKSHSLKRLHISTTWIEKIEGLEQLTKLEILDLHHAEIEKIEGLDTLVNLKELNLSQNAIRKVENLDNLQKLEYLLLDANEIVEFDPRFLMNLHSPCTISLIGNSLRTLENVPDHVKILYEGNSWVPRGI